MNKTLCFTGHRPHKLNGYSPLDNRDLLFKLRDVIVDYIENGHVTTFISGMALGIDTWSAKIVLKLKEDYPDIRLISAIPCDKQWSKWGKNDISEWENIINKADKVHYVSDEPYTPWCMDVRNRWMVDNSNYVVAVWDGTTGGTHNCVKYAKKKQKEIIILNPNTLIVSPI